MNALERLKDLFYFRRGQMMGALCLMLLLLLLLSTDFFVEGRRGAEAQGVDSVAVEQLAAFEAQCHYKDSMRRHPEWQKKRKPDTYYVNRIIAAPPHFNPNKADSLLLSHIGFSPFVVSNIMRFRAAGGHYRSPAHFARTYGLDEQAYDAVKNYLVFDTVAVDIPVMERERFVSHKVDTIIDLNACDTADLVKLRGIGSYRAAQIVAYRTRLGGYYSHSQLYEIDALDSAVVDTIMHHSTIDRQLIKKINVNTASKQVLRQHPYITYDQALSIYDYRREHFRIDSLDVLPSLDYITPADYQRIKPYLEP